ncbi:MAG TPA: T9SS type A sorting domain-containing protein [Mucilaginibacter sp.]|jgi:sugar lactone lactonase YvrE
MENDVLKAIRKLSLYFLLFCLVLFSSTALAQAPVINYNTPTNIFTTGTAISSLVPTNTGGTIPATIYAQVTTFAGSGTAGKTNATGTNAKFNLPRWITIDATGTQYVADEGNNEIREVTSAAAVTLLAGSKTGQTGLTNGSGINARFNGPYAITNDGVGNLYVADFTNNEIREIVASTGAVTLLAGSATGASGLANGTGTAAGFSNPAGIVYDPVSGTIYISDFANNEIREMTTAGAVTLFAGNSAGALGLTNGTGSGASFKGPNGIAVDASGNVYVADQNNNEIRKITPAGVVTLFAGSPTGASGSTDGIGSAALFLNPQGICVDASGNLYVTDTDNNTIRLITPAGVVTTIAGIAGTAGSNNAIGTSATFNQSRGIIVDPTSGNLFVSDYNNNMIREIIPTGYTVSPALPAGLLFDSTTGTISGTPTAISPATNYTITGYNTSGSSSTVISIACGQSEVWTAGSNTTAWATGGNWSTGIQPGVNDAVSIGVSAYTNAKEPSITAANVTVGSITFGNNGGNHTLTVNSPGTLTVGSYITVPTAVTMAITGAGNINIAPGGIININGTGVLNTTLTGKLTLKSDSTGSASIGQITTTSITGTGASSINVERYLTGGSGYRGYRLLSSPVYAATVASNNVYSINYLQNSVYLTGAAGGGFDKTSNPTLYLFREDQAPSAVSFTSGNFEGISAINNTPAYNYSVTGAGTSGTYNLPVGNGYMMFFRGNRASAAVGVETLTSYTTPVADTLTASGTLNAGQIIVHDWYTPASANLGWTNASANSAVRGFNLVGNPYASSIDWERYDTVSTTTGIYAHNIGSTIYELNPATNNYDTYQVGGVFTNHGSRTIASGQGFFVIAANNTSPQLIFNESAKTTTQNTGLNLFMSTKADLASINNTKYDQHLRLQMTLGATQTDDTYIGFNAAASPQYVLNEDAPYKFGTGPVNLSTISGDKIYLAINKLPLPKLTQTTIPLYVTARAYGTYKLNMTELKGIPQLFEIWLMDSYSKDSLDIRHNRTYAFNITTDTNSYGSNRFKLVMRQDPALGVHLLNFKAVKVIEGVRTVWITENEADYTNFTVERSTDNGATFYALGSFVSSGMGTYSFLDKNPLPIAIGTNQYRLKLVDLNGGITYSHIVTLIYGNSSNNPDKSNLTIYPNPAKNTLNLTIGPAFNSNPPTLQPVNPITNSLAASANTNNVYSIKIVNTLGMVMQAATTTQQNWQTDLSSLSPGTYILQVTNNNTVIGKGTFVKL